MKIRFAIVPAIGMLASLASAQVVSVSAQALAHGPAPALKRLSQGMSTTFHGDMRRSGYYENWTGPRALHSSWQLNLSSAGFGYAQPVIASNGTVYVKDLADVLFAVSPSGNVLWQLDLGSGATGGSFPAADSTVTIVTEKVSVGTGLFLLQERLYVTSGDAQVWKLTPEGHVIWSVQLPKATTSCSVAVRKDGLLYATSYDLGGSFDGALSLIDKSGFVVWELDTLSQPAINGAPSLDALGNVTLNGFNHATKYDAVGGSELYDFTAGFHIYGSIAQDVQGRAYFGAGDGKLYSLKADGSLRWSLPAGGFVTSTPAVTPSGNTYVGGWDGALYAASPTGNQLWAFPTGAEIESSPIVDGQGYIYFISADGLLYCLDPNGIEVFTASVGAGSIGTVAPGSNGRLYATSAAGDLILFVP